MERILEKNKKIVIKNEIWSVVKDWGDGRKRKKKGKKKGFEVMNDIMDYLKLWIEESEEEMKLRE